MKPNRLTKKEREQRLNASVRAALKLRREVFQVPDAAAICPVGILENWSVIDVHCQVEIKDGFESNRATTKPVRGRASAAYIPSAGKSRIWVTAATIAAARNMDSDARFSIAHEIGHRVNQHQGVKFDFLTMLDKNLYRADEAQDESEADYFGAVFLAPPSEFQNFETIEDFALFYGIPMKAARIVRQLALD